MIVDAQESEKSRYLLPEPGDLRYVRFSEWKNYRLKKRSRHLKAGASGWRCTRKSKEQKKKKDEGYHGLG